MSTDSTLEHDDQQQEDSSDEANQKPLVEPESPDPIESNSEVSSPASDQTKAEDTSGANAPAEDVDAEPGTPEDESTIEETPGMSIIFSLMPRLPSLRFCLYSSECRTNWLVAFFRAAMQPTH